MKLGNVKSTRICAFCKHWYDPTNSAVEPQNTVAGFWKYDPNVREKCLKTNLERAAWTSCGQYECKF